MAKIKLKPILSVLPIVGLKPEKLIQIFPDMFRSMYQSMVRDVNPDEEKAVMIGSNGSDVLLVPVAINNETNVTRVVGNMVNITELFKDVDVKELAEKVDKNNELPENEQKPFFDIVLEAKKR